MNLHPNLARRVRAGEAIKPWLVWGPVFENVSARVPGLSLFEQVDGSGGRALLEEVIGEARAFLAGLQPAEAGAAAFRGQSAAWSLARGPEPFLSWGGYFTQNHLAALAAACTLAPQPPGARRWRLQTRIASYVLVALNGQVIFETPLKPASIMEGLENAEYTFEAALPPGESQLAVLLLRVGRMARVGFRLDALDGGDLQVRTALPQGVDAAARSRLEEQAAGICLERDVLYPQHPLRLRLGGLPVPEFPLALTLSGPGEGQPRAWQVAPDRPGLPELQLLPDCAALPDGDYRLDCAWQGPGGRPLTALSFALHKTSPTPDDPGFERLEARKQQALQHYAAGWDARPIWNQLACYALGRYEQVDEGVLRAACEFIAARADTSDFVIQAVLRLLYWEKKSPHLSPGLRALMKETVLGFKYWVDEPGDTVMWMDSENHRFLFHSAEWLAGQLYPLDEFSNSRQRGLFHALKGRTYAAEWMRQRGRYGFDEWHSNTYYPASMLPLFNIYDFAPYEDHKFRYLAGALLDYAFFNLAADAYRGALGTTHGRTYLSHLMHPDFEGTSSLMWTAFGRGALRREGGAMGPVAFATSAYRLPEILARIATDDQAVVESRVRQGIATKGDQEFYPNRERFADFRVYRTPDYLLCGLQDYRPGQYDPAVHTAQVTLGNKALIFWSCPYTSNTGGGLRPDYWSGNAAMPRVVMQANLLSLTYRLANQAWLSHCYFEPARFDEVRLAGQWAFARAGGGYVGIWSQHGYHLGRSGQYAGRELVCETPENTWLVECGRAADWGSFDAFCAALSAAAVDCADGVVSYASPSAGRFVTGWQVQPTLAGQPIALHDYPLVDSPWAHSDFGSGVIKIRHGSLTHELHF